MNQLHTTSQLVAQHDGSGYPTLSAQFKIIHPENDVVMETAMVNRNEDGVRTQWQVFINNPQENTGE